MTDIKKGARSYWKGIFHNGYNTVISVSCKGI